MSSKSQQTAADSSARFARESSFMIDKLETILTKYNALTEEMADPAVIAQPERWTQCAKEHAEIAETAEKYLAYKKAEQEMKDAFNAAAEEVKNTCFLSGNAVLLDFPDESFDAVTSNYVYHNIARADKQALLMETLRVLKKGGVFAIHDLMSPTRYGNMQMFVERLKEQGYEQVELIDTTKGMFMSPKEAKWLMLRGSALIVGKK